MKTFHKSMASGDDTKCSNEALGKYYKTTISPVMSTAFKCAKVTSSPSSLLTSVGCGKVVHDPTAKWAKWDESQINDTNEHKNDTWNSSQISARRQEQQLLVNQKEWRKT